MSKTDPVELSLSRALVLMGRALRLRCPNCGGGPVLHSWLRLRERCPRCGLRLDRGESDYFLGAYLFNLVAVELLIAFGMLAVLVATWPDPPWNFLQYGSIVLMLAGAFVCYPFAKTTWLAFDLMLRPLTPEELRWHREGSVDGPLPHL